MNVFSGGGGKCGRVASLRKPVIFSSGLAGGRPGVAGRHFRGWRGSRRWGWGPFSYLSPFWINPLFLPVCPAICSPTFIPVCGSNGQTYYNECFLVSIRRVVLIELYQSGNFNDETFLAETNRVCKSVPGSRREARRPVRVQQRVFQ